VEQRAADRKVDMKMAVGDMQTKTEGGKWKQLRHILFNPFTPNDI
jgi:hypothetical protein